ncbi:hypothetical protein K4L04_10980 [Phaeobacter inhibens]|uniref:hypothetical protein n=1 Tax=Phaeobacter inhibens TaxID=221822 RepID=UPI0021A86F1E|nr:hypothetical protein [Phaeobacter inhibens]UWR74995.1 hypothetical protein K4L04_10980 [Phaeobacter inhibens]
MFDSIRNVVQSFLPKKKASTIKRAGFFPVAEDLEGKHNFRRQFYVDRDGSIIETIFLNVWNKFHREEIISRHYCKHFSRFYFKPKLGEDHEFFVVGRDCPWDFEIILGGSRHFFLEVTSISSPSFFRVLGYENEADSKLSQNEILGKDVLRIEKNFPGTFPASFLEKIKASKGNRKKYFDNPCTKQGPRIFTSQLPSIEDNVAAVLKEAIENKSQKRHINKESTVLVIDNLTMTSEPDDFFKACKEIQDTLASAPFEEIWVYTGYFSDDDGENAEFAFFPLKAPEYIWEAMHSMLESGALSPNRHGIAVV